MQPLVVALAYGVSLALALALLYYFQTRWYWHTLSLAAALALGLIPLPPEWALPDLLVGAVFLFLFVWGLGAVVFRTHHAHPHLPHRV